MAAKAISKKELQAMLKPELVKHAQELGIDTKDLTKDQILDAINALVRLPEKTSLSEDVGLPFTKFSVDVTTPSTGVGENVEIMKMQLHIKQMEHEIKLREIENKQREIDKQERDSQREHEFKMARLQAQTSLEVSPDNSHSSGFHFKADTAAKLLPKLVSEQETETFLITFEKIANLNKWPKENWAAVLQTQLKGKGLKVFSELSLKECGDYEILKKAILTAYELCPEVYRKRFRSYQKSTTETHADFAFRLTQSFKRWLNGVKTWDDVELLRETFLMEQFMETVPTDLKLWLTDRDPKSLEIMARLADQYVTLHKSCATSENGQDSKNMLVNSRPFIQSSKPWQKPKTSSYADKDADTPSEKLENKKHDRFYNKSDLSKVRCFYCQKTGHKIAQCRTKLHNEEKEAKKEIGSKNLLASQDVMLSDSSPSSTIAVTDQLPIHPLFKPYCTTAQIVNRDESLTHIEVLRDTGALQSVVKSSVVSEVDHVQTGQVRLLKGITREIIEVPLVEIHLRLNKFDEMILCGVVEELPEGVDFLLGNDIPSLSEQVGQQVSLPIGGLPALPLTQTVITRAQAAAVQQHTAAQPTTQVIDRAHVNRSIVESIDLNAVQDREELINLQQQDDNLTALFEMVIERDFPVGKPYYFMQNSVLMHRDIVRKTRQEVEQVVIPRCLRAKILEMAHDIPASGHLGIHKTKARLWPHFYWPGMNKQVIAYCRSCDTCQRLGKGGKPPKAPLIQVPIITEPWKRIAIDIVGPLPTCEKSRNRFILTVIDLATHYPEAIALTEHTAAQVAKALITVFSRFGFPSEILSDQGSDFTSELMRLFMSEFNIGHVKISAYHPQSNAICERWNGTMKSMIRALKSSFLNDWDECLPWILFAYREIPVETLGFSPFELTFGRHVYGPLGMLKSTWLRSEQSLNKARSNVIQFMVNMREKLAICQDLALKVAQKAQTKEKLWYDRASRDRTFEIGQRVLALLPMQGKPLEPKYQGPFTIIDRVGPVDYLIATPTKRRGKRLCHVNMLKPYFDRTSDSMTLPTEVNFVGGIETELTEIDVGPEVCKTPDRFNLEHLSMHERIDLEVVLNSFADIFSDVPGRTTLCKHAIVLKPNTPPIRLHPYRVNPSKAEQMRKEIDFMLELGIIEESNSVFASPVVLVPKSDGSIRFCCNYKKLNDVTQPDVFPLPRIDDLIDKIGKAKYMTKLDLSRGYWQVPMEEASIPLSAFVTPFGQFQWKYMPFGLRNAPGTFSRLITSVLRGLEAFTGAYLDDLIIFSDSWSEHLKQLSQVFERLRAANLTVKKSKCVFATAEVEYLGHLVGKGKVAPRSAKVESILRFPRPKDRKQLQSYLGVVGYFRKFIPHFAHIAATLTNLLRKGTKFLWTEEADKAFLDLKSRLASKPILRPPDFDLPFAVAVDASNVAIGAYLFQTINDIEHPICFYSKRLNVHQQNYATVEKEAFALLSAVRIFNVYFGSHPVTVYTDHSPLQFLRNMSNHNQKLLRWSLELQQYNLSIVHRPGKANLIPDILSRPA